MIRKIGLSLVFSLFLSSMFSGAALAGGELPHEMNSIHRARVRRMGEVVGVDVGGMTFDLKTRWDETIHFIVDENTRFIGFAAGLEALQAGMKVMVVATPTPASTEGLLARRVFVTNPARKLMIGTVSSVDPLQEEINLINRQKAEVTIEFNKQTRFRGLARETDEVHPGMRAAVRVDETEDGILKALWVFTPMRFQLRVVRGEITTLSVDQGTFELRTYRDTDLTLKADETTVYHSPTGEVVDLQDLRPGMRAAIIYWVDVDGSLHVGRLLAPLLPQGLEGEASRLSLESPSAR
jgi:hypothetical protein